MAHITDNERQTKQRTNAKVFSPCFVGEKSNRIQKYTIFLSDWIVIL